MSDQAKEFLAQWELEQIEVVPRSDRQDQARRLALHCRQDAAKAGINEQDLQATRRPRQIWHGNGPRPTSFPLTTGVATLSGIVRGQGPIR
jgi:hypothetical protein